MRARVCWRQAARRLQGFRCVRLACASEAQAQQHELHKSRAVRSHRRTLWARPRRRPHVPQVGATSGVQVVCTALAQRIREGIVPCLTGIGGDAVRPLQLRSSHKSQPESAWPTPVRDTLLA
jgi:hypothetical protein